MRISLGFTGYDPFPGNLLAARRADTAGFDGIWQAEHIGSQDGLVAGAAFAAATSHLDIGVMGLSTAGRHPGMTAMALSTMSELAPGRIRAAIGTGVPEMIATVGAQIRRPVTNILSFHDDLSRALRGEELTRNDGFVFDGFSVPARAQPAAIDVLGMRPRMVEAAARHADGLVLSAGSGPAYLHGIDEQIRPILAEGGRRREDFRVTVVGAVFVGDGSQTGYQRAIERMYKWEPRVQAYLTGGQISEDDLESAWTAGRLEDLFTPSVVESLVIISEPDELRARIPEAVERYAENGVDDLILMNFVPPIFVDLLIDAVDHYRSPSYGKKHV